MVVFEGEAAFEKLEKALKGEQIKRLLCVCGKSCQKLPVMDRVRNLGTELVISDDFEPNPDISSAVKGIEIYRNSNCDGIIAIGGGSAMDVAKCIKLCHLDENVFDVYNAYTLMQDSGYLSVGDTFKTEIPQNEVLNHYGLSIIFGSGVCRNQADNLRNVSVELGYNAGLASGELYTGFSKNQTNQYAKGSLQYLYPIYQLYIYFLLSQQLY